MADGHRIYPVKYLVLHHSVGPEFVNAGDLAVQDWFDRIGKNRGYKGKRSYHTHPNRNKETYAMAQYALREYNMDGNRYGWRVTPLMKDPLNNVAWHAGNWKINQQSIGIEVCGNYLNKLLPEKALWIIADYFRDYDRSLGGNLEILGHKEVSATQCPGRIMEQKGEIIRLFNQKYFMTQIEDLYNQTKNQLKIKLNELTTLKNSLKVKDDKISSLEDKIKNLSNTQPSTNKCQEEEKEIERLKKIALKYKKKAKELEENNNSNPSGNNIIQIILDNISKFFKQKKK